MGATHKSSSNAKISGLSPSHGVGVRKLLHVFIYWKQLGCAQGSSCRWKKKSPELQKRTQKQSPVHGIWGTTEYDGTASKMYKEPDA